MAISLKTNLPAMAATRHMNRNAQEYNRALERVASGKRINQPGDDGAGMAISSSLRAKIVSVNQAERNAEDGRSLIQVAGGAVNDISNLLVRIRELATQAASDTIGDTEREMVNLEVQEAVAEVDRIAESTYYLGTPLLNGEGSELSFQVGPDAGEANQINYDSSNLDIRASSLGVDGVDVTDKDSARDALETVDTALSALYIPMAQLGAVQNRMQATIDNLQNYSENLTAANSRILDADFAKETAEVAKGDIQRQAGAAVLAQAAHNPSVVLRLLNGF